MKRRALLASGLSLAGASAALAQKPPPLISILGSGASSATSSTAQVNSLTEALREAGLEKGRDYRLETRWAGGDSHRFPSLAGELLALRPSVVIVGTIAAAEALQEQSRTMPIVMSALNDPVSAGLVQSLARPGGNITGVATMAEAVLPKLIEILREALPAARQIAVMTNPSNPSHRRLSEQFLEYAGVSKFAVLEVAVATPPDLLPAFASLARHQPEALVILGDENLLALTEIIVPRALAQRLPPCGTFPTIDFVRIGGLLNYARDRKDSFRSVARLVKKILDGANPAELPVEQPTKFVLGVNLKTARALGLTVPPALLARADEVIE